MVIRNGPKAGRYGSRTTDHLSGTMLVPAQSRTVGWQPTCSCPDNDGGGRCVVLDPFAGSGTTLLVAERYRRKAVGIELNSQYLKLIKKRLAKVQLKMFG